MKDLLDKLNAVSKTLEGAPQEARNITGIESEWEIVK